MLKFEIEKQIRSVKDEMVWLFKTALFYGSFGALILLWINFLYEPWPIFSNPIEDFLFMRSGGPLLYANHVVSEVAILIPATYFAIKLKSWKVIWVILATASIHEYVIQIANSVFGLFGATSIYYIAEIGIIFAIGLLVSTRSQRYALLEILIICGAFELLWTVAILAFNLNPQTIIGFKSGPAFFDWRENLLEIVSWILPSSWWFIGKWQK